MVQPRTEAFVKLLRHINRGKFSAEEVDEKPGRLLGERRFEDALMSARVITHFRPMATLGGKTKGEKGVDVSLALDAYEAAYQKKVNFIVLVTGDGDFVPLVERLISLNCRVMVAAWDVQSPDGQLNVRTAQTLLNVVPYPLCMQAIIDNRVRKSESVVKGLFMDDRLDSKEVRSNPYHQQPVSRPAQTAGLLRSSGVIVSLPQGRDFGFIRPDNGGEDLFFHRNGVRTSNFYDLQYGNYILD